MLVETALSMCWEINSSKKLGFFHADVQSRHFVVTSRCMQIGIQLESTECIESVLSWYIGRGFNHLASG